MATSNLSKDICEGDEENIVSEESTDEEVFEEDLHLPSGSGGHSNRQQQPYKVCRCEGVSGQDIRANLERMFDKDQVTKEVLLLLVKKKKISQIDNKCFFTRKGADMYHALSKTGVHYTVKVYTTSLFAIKDWDQYHMGNLEVKRKYFKKHCLEMLRIWARKELRYLKLMQQKGLKVPAIVLFKSHVLVMNFIGNDGQLPPKLKDVELSQSEAKKIYRDAVMLLWKLFSICNLVYVDFSEFNLLYHNGEIYIFDTTQCVESNHPQALEFLEKYCGNITKYFEKYEAASVSFEKMFHFVTNTSINEDNMDDCLNKFLEIAA